MSILDLRFLIEDFEEGGREFCIKCSKNDNRLLRIYKKIT